MFESDFNLFMDKNSMFFHAIWPIVLGGGGYYVWYYFFLQEGKNLQKKFQSLGNMSGMKKSEIIKKCGAPNGISHLQGGSACVWYKSGYRIEIHFDENDVFIAIAQETAV